MVVLSEHSHLDSRSTHFDCFDTRVRMLHLRIQYQVAFCTPKIRRTVPDCSSIASNDLKATMSQTMSLSVELLEGQSAHRRMNTRYKASGFCIIIQGPASQGDWNTQSTKQLPSTTQELCPWWPQSQRLLLLLLRPAVAP